jgi:hypothetical protein
MALLKAYFDASFTDVDKPTRITAIGGYIGPESAWEYVEQPWLANREMWGLSEFSLAKISAGRTAVKQTDARLCVESLSKIIFEANLDGLSAAISDQDWEAAIKNRPQGDGSGGRSYRVSVRHRCRA